MQKGSGRMEQPKEVRPMTNEQFQYSVNGARLDELERIKRLADDPEKLMEYLMEREKVLRNALDKHLNT